MDVAVHDSLLYVMSAGLDVGLNKTPGLVEQSFSHLLYRTLTTTSTQLNTQWEYVHYDPSGCLCLSTIVAFPIKIVDVVVSESLEKLSFYPDRQQS